MGARHLVLSDVSTNTFVTFGGLKYYFPTEALIPIPTVESVYDFGGDSVEAGSSFVFSAARDGNLIADFGGGNYRVIKAGDIEMVTPALVFWSPEEDGVGQCFRYNADDSMVWDLFCLPATNRQWFELVGMYEADPAAASKPARTQEEHEAQNPSRGETSPLTRDFLFWME